MAQRVGVAEGTYPSRIRRITPDGIIRTFGGGGALPIAEGVRASDANLDAWPSQLSAATAAPDGTVYFSSIDGAVWHIEKDQIIRQVVAPSCAVPPSSCWWGVSLGSASHMVAPSEGVVYVSDFISSPSGYLVRVRRVSADGGVTLVAGGTGSSPLSSDPPSYYLPYYGGDNGLATAAGWTYATGLSTTPDGALLIADMQGGRVRVVSAPVMHPGGNGLWSASPDGAAVGYFDAQGRHVRTVDAYTGATMAEIAYDDAGRLSRVTDSFGNSTSIERDGSGRPTAIVAPHGQRTTLSVGAGGYLESVADPGGNTIHLDHGGDGLLRTLTDAKGNVHSFDYTALGRLRVDQEPGNGSKTVSQSRTAAGTTTTVTSALGRTLTIFDEESLLEKRRSITDSAGLTTVVHKERKGLTTTAAPSGAATQVVQTADPLFGLDAMYPASFSLTTASGKRLNGATSRSVTLAQQNDPASLTAATRTFTVGTRTYNASFSRASGQWTVTSPAQRRTVLTVSPSGLPLSVRYGNLTQVQLGYNEDGEMQSVQQGGRLTSIAYDERGRISSWTDPLQRSVTFEYDESDRVKRQVFDDGRAVVFGYDENGNVTTITPPSRPLHTFDYTGRGAVASYAPPLSGLTHYTYDADGQLTTIERPAGKVTLDYDAAGRLTTIATPTGVRQVTYDGVSGNVSSISSEAGQVTFGYDSPLLTSVTWSGAVAGSISFGYDSDFRVNTETTSGSAIRFGYDGDDLLTSAGALTLTRRPADGLLSGTRLGNVTDAWTYNDSGEPLTYSASYGGTQILAESFTRDELGRITDATRTIYGSSVAEHYDYDPAGRLKQVTEGSVPQAIYDYDSNGNRLKRSSGSGVEEGAYDAEDRLVSYAGATFTYDGDGNLATRTDASGTTTYTYDAMGDLVKVVLSDGTVIEYTVDALGRRVERKVNGTVTAKWLWSDQLRVAAELGGDGALRSRFIYGSRPNVPDYMIRGGVTYRLVSDHLGSVRAVVDVATGAIAQQLAYDEFGRVLGDSSPGFQPLGYAGGLYDAQTGLVRFGARDYDPQTGRWTTKDPKLFAGGDANLYGYVINDPVNLIDPMGTDWVDTTANISAGIGDALLLGYGDELRAWTDRQFGWQGSASVDRCSGAYRVSTGVTSAAMLAVGTGRIGYAAGAKGIALGAGTVEEAVAARNALKIAGRLGLNQTARVYSTEQILAKYGSAEEAIAAAGRTNIGFNAAGAAAIGGAINNLLNQPECGCR